MLHLSRLIFILIFILNMPIPEKSAVVLKCTSKSLSDFWESIAA